MTDRESAALSTLRRKAIRLLVAGAWAAAATLGLIGLALDDAPSVGVAAAAVLVNVLPTFAALAGRHDLGARLMAATLAAVHPALLVMLLTGHDWQMDAHMYFFVALAALTVLCDWRPIVLASALVLVHHLALSYLAAEWVFADGAGGLARLVFHAAAVTLQALALSCIAIGLVRLVERQEATQAESARLAEEAVAGRAEVERALAQAHAAGQHAARETHRREQVEQHAAAARRTEMLALADGFRRSIAATAAAMGSACGDLDGSARALHGLARQANREAGGAAAAVGQASLSAAALAERAHELSESIATIADTADAQAALSEAAQGLSASGREAVTALTARSATVGGFAETISGIASQTNLLALNATIEAARAGEVGRGFAIVAGEVKQLATETTGATAAIRSLAESIVGGASQAEQALAAIDATVGDVAHAAGAIRAEVGRQRGTATAIEQAAVVAAAGANRISGDFAGLVRVAGDAEALSDRVATAATDLAAIAAALQTEASGFVGRLSAA